MRSRQPPTMLGERVFTSLVDKSDERPDEHALHRAHTSPYCSTIEATTTELESHQIDVVYLPPPPPPPPTTSSTSHPTTVYLSEERPEQSSDVKFLVSPSQSISPRKVQLSPELRTTQFHPSGLPSESIEATSTPTVFDPDWLNTPSIIWAIELLGRPMTLDELRRWTNYRAANRDAF